MTTRSVASAPLQLVPWAFVLLWSTGFIGAKLGLPHAEPLSFLLVRYLIVILAMALLAVVTGAPWPTDVQHWAHIGIAGLLVHALYLGGVFTAIHRGLPAGVASLIVGTQPILTAIATGLFMHEQIPFRQWLGLAFGFLGVGLVIGGRWGGTGADLTHFGFDALWPALLALAGITVGTLYQKRFCPRFDWRTGAVAQFLPTALVTACVAAGTESFQIDWQPEFLFALAWLVLVLSIGAISLLNWLIRHGTAVNVASLFYLVPPCTALVAWLWFDETLSGMALFGMAMAIWGVWLVRR
jgi:drug/metabolite transporter (DMT)-like permease